MRKLDKTGGTASKFICISKWEFIVVLSLVGIVLTTLGGYLVYLDGGPYYIASGAATIAVAVLMIRRSPKAAEVYAGIVTVPQPSWRFPGDRATGNYNDSKSARDGKGGYVIAYALEGVNAQITTEIARVYGSASTIALG